MSKTLPILIVEDDAALREAVRDTLELSGQSVLAVGSGPEALSILAAHAVSLVVSDVRMDPMDGIALLKEVRREHPHLPVVLMTAYAEVDRAVEAMRSGACDFLLKPFDPDALLAHVARYKLPDVMDDAGVVADDAASRSLFALAGRVAQADVTVLLTGESGTGKEVVARYIHRHSVRSAGPFVAINCAAIPESLLEATLFGYEKGAFTGAQTAQAGKFEQAQDGSLLLDEVTEMSLGLQAKLLRVLQEREVERVGGKKPIALNIRVIATSNRDMAEAVKRGALREDLFYRLNVFPLLVPSLRQRPADVLPIAKHFLALHGSRTGHLRMRLAPSAEAALQAYSWPGNVRELENVIQRSLILASGDTVEADHLQLQSSVFASGAGEVPVSTEEKLAPSRRSDSMSDVERDHILATLASVKGSRRTAAERLGISERTLRNKLHQYRDEGYYKGKEED